MNNTFPQNVFVHCTLGTFHNHFCENFESHFVIFKPQGKQISCLWPKKGGRYTKRIPFFFKGVIQSTSDAKFWCTYILGYTLYSCFEKGCQKKCMRHSRKVLWVVFRSLVSKKFQRMAREATDIFLWVLKESNKSRFDSYSVRNNCIDHIHITFWDCRVHSFCDNLSRNSRIQYTHY